MFSVEVTDTGTGHAEGEAGDQFQPFGQTRTEGTPGAGGAQGHSSPGSALQASQGQNGAAGGGGVGGHSQSSSGSGGVIVGESTSGVHPGGDGAYRGSGLGMAICQQFAQVQSSSHSAPVHSAISREALSGVLLQDFVRSCAVGVGPQPS